MAKKKEVVRVAKLQFNAGQAKPGPELAGLGIVMPEFTKQFNDATRDRNGEPVPVAITVYKDKSFDFKLFTAPTSYMLKKAAGVEAGSPNSKTTIIATIKKEQLDEIVKYKLVDLNTNDFDAAVHTIAGTARNMGILIEGYDDIKKAKAEAKEAAKEAIAEAAFEAQLEAETAQLSSDEEQSASVEVINEKEEESE